ncbi:acetate--CoA ligase family protein [Altererythrobacter lutimaris]|uniref:Acetate--CoA ligase family protein n=1 Tax=Altererythrobacter lutimaris TaxID=2743979 RepID=A0A850HA13_9SPHN|nr:acetate--CoA ligase family protein [Altererythrobacter lutimaris]NVE96007.1 acetate--CoA ligase family protein [Altererythrobacter lutimaris]
MTTLCEFPTFESDWLKPERVVLVGASSKLGSVGQVIGANLQSGSRAFKLQTVNPQQIDWSGTTHFNSLSAIPMGPGLGVVAIPAQGVSEAIATLGKKGIRYAVVISAGLERGSELGNKMLNAARDTGVRLIGPNCLGLILPHHRLNASFARSMPAAGDLALLSQSGAIATAMLEWAEPREVGFSAVVSVGDMAQTGMGELIEIFAQDAETRAILIYLEGLNDAQRFMEAARKTTLTKPVIVLKAGRSQMAGRAALSHTGALAGSWDVYRAAFREAGIVAVDTLEDMFDVASLLSCYPEGAKENLAIITNGGGAGILAVDAMARTGARLADLSDKTVNELNAFLPTVWSRANPIDIIGDADASRYSMTIETVLADPGVDALLVMNCPTGLLKPGEAAQATVDSVERARKGGSDKPVFGCWLGDANFAAASQQLNESRIPIFSTPSDAVRGFSALLQIRRASAKASSSEVEVSNPKTMAQAQALMQSVKNDGRRILSEIEAKTLLAEFGIPVVETRLIACEDDFQEACAAIKPPYALKIVSPDITHKSDFGGVALGLSNASAVRRAAEAMKKHISDAFPDARLDGFAIQPMVARKSAHELFAGLAQDTTFGPIVLFGAGGTAIEVIADKAIGLPPVSSRQAQEMIAATRISRQLAGYRHVPQADLVAITKVLEALSRLAVTLPEIAELDVNPLLADADGVVALDARVILR